MIKEWKLGDKNKTASYLLPLVGESVDQFYGPLRPLSNFVNAFCGAEEYPQYNRHVFLLYRYNDSELFKRLENRIKERENFVECYDPDALHVMYILEIPDVYLQALEKFRLGKYSEISEQAKQHILRFHKVNLTSTPEHPIYGTLYKQEFQFLAMEKKYEIEIPRDQEVSSKPDFRKEIYLNEYKINNHGMGVF